MSWTLDASAPTLDTASASLDGWQLSLFTAQINAAIQIARSVSVEVIVSKALQKSAAVVKSVNKDVKVTGVLNGV